MDSKAHATWVFIVSSGVAPQTPCSSNQPNNVLPRSFFHLCHSVWSLFPASSGHLLNETLELKDNSQSQALLSGRRTQIKTEEELKCLPSASQESKLQEFRNPLCDRIEEGFVPYFGILGLNLQRLLLVQLGSELNRCLTYSQTVDSILQQREVYT